MDRSIQKASLFNIRNTFTDSKEGAASIDAAFFMSVKA